MNESELEILRKAAEVLEREGTLTHEIDWEIDLHAAAKIVRDLISKSVE